MNAKQQAFIDMAKEYQKEGKVVIRENKRQLDIFFYALANDEFEDFYTGSNKSCYIGGKYQGKYT